MDAAWEFRVLIVYLAALYAVPLICWRRTRRSPALVGARGEQQVRARWVATALLVGPLLNFLIDGPWPWYPELGVPNLLRWAAAAPATLAVLLLVWARRHAETGRDPGTATETEQNPDDPAWIGAGPYRWLRHPQLLASSIFCLSLSLLASNGVVLISTICGVLLLRLVVAPAVDADLKAEFGVAYEHYQQRTGIFFFPLRRVPRARYAVPRKFGLSAVLALTTIFALLFGVLNFWDAPPAVYLFVATEISAICLAQILFGFAARRVSALTGAVLLPFWVAMSVDLHQLVVFSWAGIAAVGLMLGLLGALLGYCIGGLAAGFFLAMDLLEPYLPGAKRDSLGSLAIKPNKR